MPTSLRPAVRLLLLGACVVGVAACGQPEASEPTDGGTVRVAIQPTLEPIDTEFPTFDATAAGAAGVFDANEHLTTRSCAAVGGVWSYAGTLTNPEASELTFTVGVFLVGTADMSPVATREVEVTVPAGESVPVDVPGLHQGAGDDLECVTGVTVKED